VEGLDERDIRNMDCEAVQVEKLWCAVMVGAVVLGSAGGGRVVKVQGPDSRQRSSCGPGIGNSSMDLASVRDETQSVDRMVARTAVVQKQVECKIGSGMSTVQCRSFQCLNH
jgi:hypothetical protein